MKTSKPRRLLKADLAKLNARMETLFRFYETKTLDASDPAAAALLRVLIRTLEELKAYAR